MPSEEKRILLTGISSRHAAIAASLAQSAACQILGMIRAELMLINATCNMSCVRLGCFCIARDAIPCSCPLHDADQRLICRRRPLPVRMIAVIVPDPGVVCRPRLQ